MSSRVATPEVPDSDKWAHFFVYGLLGTLVFRAVDGRRSAVWLALAATSLFGATDELHQYFVPGRSSDVVDWLTDTAGAALAIGLYAHWAWYRGLLEMPLGRKRRVENPAATAKLAGQ